MTRRDEIIAGIPTAEQLDALAVRCEGPCPDIDRAIEKRDNAPDRFADARCCKCGEPVGEKYHVSHGFVTCDLCRNKEAAEFATYPPAHRSNWDE